MEADDPKVSPADAICRFVPPFIRFLREGLAQVGMSPARFQLLQALREDGPQSMVDLAGALSVTKRNVTTLVDGLETAGLAARRPHPTDRRSTLVELTAEGAALAAQAAQVQRRHLEGLLARLDAGRREDMARALLELVDAMKETRGGGR